MPILKGYTLSRLMSGRAWIMAAGVGKGRDVLTPCGQNTAYNGDRESRRYDLTQFMGALDGGGPQ